uniref:Uncharacterized protein n=1 Tax=Anguilla anguilla TaxID=7936 RepID=A0A0E9RWW8_ANGAN
MTMITLTLSVSGDLPFCKFSLQP